MIVKNEELTLRRCLSSAVTLADEIIIVDTGSVDRTKKIAAEFTDKIFDYKWDDDFAAARNYSFSKASMDYILWLDADDIILPGDIVKLERLKESLPGSVSAVMLKYNVGFDMCGNVNFSYYRERLVKRSEGFKWKERVHEYIETRGRVIRADACVTHTKKPRAADGRNLHIYEKLLSGGGPLSPRGTYYYAKELMESGKTAEAARQFESFLNSGKGWVEDNIDACGALSECLMQSDPQNALRFLFKSFEYDVPRPEICCQIGYYFKNSDKFRRAAYWFELALIAHKDAASGFYREEYTGYIPCIELAVCYNRLGDDKKAFGFNEMAAKYKPECPAVSNNRICFKKAEQQN